MRTRLVAVVAGDGGNVIASVRTAPPANLLLLFDADGEKSARDLKATLAPILDVTLAAARGDVIASVLRIVGKAAREAREVGEGLAVNLGRGDSLLALAALSAAHLYGVRAFAEVDGKLREMPVLRASFDDALSGPKLAVLAALDRAGGSVDSLAVLTEMAGVDKSLLSYHLRGSREAKGLEELGLVDVERGARGRLIVRLSFLGGLIVAASRAEE